MSNCKVQEAVLVRAMANEDMARDPSRERAEKEEKFTSTMDWMNLAAYAWKRSNEPNHACDSPATTYSTTIALRSTNRKR